MGKYNPSFPDDLNMCGLPSVYSEPHTLLKNLNFLTEANVDCKQVVQSWKWTTKSVGWLFRRKPGRMIQKPEIYYLDWCILATLPLPLAMAAPVTLLSGPPPSAAPSTSRHTFESLPRAQGGTQNERNTGSLPFTTRTYHNPSIIWLPWYDNSIEK
jgi:hypothetical protein